MKTGIHFLLLTLMALPVLSQNKPASTTPPAVVSVVEGLTGKQFVPDTSYTALSAEDATLLAKEPRANWDIPRESGKYMTYSNLVVGTRSYQLLIAKAPKDEFATATLLRYATPKSKPEPIARGTLKPKAADVKPTEKPN
ncbi:hypothetical protein J2I47_17380 [Fibrella sp. HMF5335]|uniref:DUF4377 domain-containing protein n=1 Tax=Fibrella rubiginis TaxID=2817060 RepID=A0A939GKY9_9BACT|nr:hypothetical protein [Fibrella rubiginis]MBO0938327.1 hypothetical protein [Fibrella rubiginis]